MTTCINVLMASCHACIQVAYTRCNDVEMRLLFFAAMLQISKNV